MKTHLLDHNYHRRYFNKVLKRATLINELYPEMNTFLDVGCNSGAISSELLKLNKDLRVIGIDLSESLVDKELLKNPRFTFVEHDLTPSTSFPHVNVIHYSAVHHHIVHKQGLISATKILGNLLSHCSDLLFETGMISEGSGFEWQKTLNDYFFSDEEHLHFLLSHLSDKLLDFDVVDNFHIHLTSRPLLALKVNVRSAGRKCSEPPQNFTSEKLIGRGAEFERLHEDDSYMYYIQNKESFSKIRTVFPSLAKIEHKVGAQILYERAVRSNDYQQGTLSFDVKEPHALQIRSIQDASNHTRANWAEQLQAWVKYLESQKILIEVDTLPIFGTNVVAIDLIEVNRNNILVDESSDKLLFIDFEPVATNNRWRNYFRVAQIMWQLGHVIYAAKYFLRFTWHYLFLCINRATFKQRLLDKRPSLASIFLTCIRSLAGKIWTKINAK